MIPSQQPAKSALRAGRKAKEQSLPAHRAVLGVCWEVADAWKHTSKAPCELTGAKSDKLLT
jgi:hypothetical protein